MFPLPFPHRTRKLVFRSRNGNDEVSTTRVSSFEFRISSTRFFHFSIFLSLSIINSLLSSAPSPFFPLSLCHRSTPPLLHSLFPFSPRHSPPLLPPPPLLGSSRCFPSLSLCRSSLSPALDTGNAVPLSRAERCGNVARAGVRRAQGRVVGTVGKFSCRRLCARRQWCSPPPSLRGILLDFLLSRSKSVSPRTQKKRGGAGRGGKRYIIRGVARKFNSIARRGSHLLPRESRTPVDAINAGVSFRDEFKIDEIYRIEESNGFLCSFKFKLSNVKSFVPVISEQVEWISTRREFVWEENGGRGSDASRFAIWRPCPGIWETRRRHRSPRLRGTERGGGAVGAHEARREG